MLWLKLSLPELCVINKYLTDEAREKFKFLGKRIYSPLNWGIDGMGRIRRWRAKERK
jgi:hypothetical protein